MRKGAEMSDFRPDDDLAKWAMEVGRTEEVTWRRNGPLEGEFKKQAGAAGLDPEHCTVSVARGRIAICLRGSTRLESEWDETNEGARLLFAQFLADLAGEPA